MHIVLGMVFVLKTKFCSIFVSNFYVRVGFGIQRFLEEFFRKISLISEA